MTQNSCKCNELISVHIDKNIFKLNNNAITLKNSEKNE